MARGWTGIEERYCEHHADAGAPQLADLLGKDRHDLIEHMAGLGVDVPPVPLLGETCPSCGRRMPCTGEAARNGICDACHTRILIELRSSREAERRAHADASAESMRRSRGGGTDPAARRG